MLSWGVCSAGRSLECVAGQVPLHRWGWPSTWLSVEGEVPLLVLGVAT